MTSVSRVVAAVIVSTIGLLPFLSGPSHTASTSSPITWSVTPASATGKDGRAAFSYSVKPGVEITDFVGISNQGTAPTTFNVYATDATDDPKDGAFSLLAANKPPIDLGSWVKLPLRKITVAPGEQARVPVTILVPSDATPGDHTAGIIASVIKLGAASHGRQVRLEERVAARVYLHVAGPVAASVAASGLTSTFTPSLNPFGSGQAGVNYSLKNTGNLRVDVLQTVTIKGPFGIVLGHIAGARILNVLPGQSVQEQLRAKNIAPLLLIWSTVSLRTEAPTDTIQVGTTTSDSGAAVPKAKAPEYPTFSSDSLTAAVPWTLLVLVIILGLAIWLLARYLGASRDRVYLAIDAAAAEARAKAQLEHDEAMVERDSRIKEPVA